MLDFDNINTLGNFILFKFKCKSWVCYPGSYVNNLIPITKREYISCPNLPKINITITQKKTHKKNPTI